MMTWQHASTTRTNNDMFVRKNIFTNKLIKTSQITWTQKTTSCISYCRSPICCTTNQNARQQRRIHRLTTDGNNNIDEWRDLYIRQVVRFISGVPWQQPQKDKAAVGLKFDNNLLLFENLNFVTTWQNGKCDYSPSWKQIYIGNYNNYFVVFSNFPRILD